MSRQVQFTGSEADLEVFLEFVRRLPGISIESVEGLVFVATHEIESAADTKAGHIAARELLSRASRLYRLYNGSDFSVGVGSKVREKHANGTWLTHHVLVAETAKFSTTFYPITVTVTGGHPIDPVPQDFRALEAHPEIEAALEYMKAEDDVYGLYKAFESVLSHNKLRDADLAMQGWATRDDLLRFRAFAQRGRHHDGGGPSVTPMDENEARGFVRRLIRKWLASKTTAM
jgi:hypothetical protein